ncbi:MAG: hypothetical protein KGK16_16880 [Bradyrhizobium sp.]|nr:hypothetical protein [Bradyrhizobium sp.]
MDWTWATSFDQIWRSPDFPIWLTLAAAGFFGITVLITLLRADRSVANGALTVITLVAIGVAVAATIRGFDPAGTVASVEARSPQLQAAALPALSCIDDMAGEAVLAACEKVLFGSSESVAAAVSYTSARIDQLTALGDVAAANRNMTPELQALRRSVERDRYGLVAYVLLARDHCTPSDCAAFRSLTNHNQISANMGERTYDGLITRYAPSWNAPATAIPAATGALAALPSSVPTGRPTNAEFPTAASTPAVSIMNPEPTTPPATSHTPPANATMHASRPAHAVAAAAKKPAPKPHVVAPVQIAPAAAPSTPAASDN